MKKYFIHNGSEQEGPFNIEELKAKGISAETPVWYEGLPIWTTANQVDELKPLFITSPPPYKLPKQATMKEQRIAEKPKGDSSLRTFIIVAILVLVAIAIYNLANNPNAIPGVKLEINTPKPLVVSTRADRASADLFKDRVTVYATVQNNGGNGNVLVMFHIIQDGKHFDRTQPFYMAQNTIKDLSATFDEVRRLRGEIKFSVDVKAE